MKRETVEQLIRVFEAACIEPRVMEALKRAAVCAQEFTLAADLRDLQKAIEQQQANIDYINNH